MQSFTKRLPLDAEKPQQWSDINISPTLKSGDLRETTNYRRGICLSAVVSKVVNKLLLSRNLILTYVTIRLAFALEELLLTF